MATAFATAERSGPRSTVLVREARAAAMVLAAVVAASALAGIAWAYLAPTERLYVVEPDRGSVLTGESAHQFDALAIFILIGMVTGVLSAAAAWRWRTVRGPVLLAGLLLGSLAGAVVMRGVGEAMAEIVHPRPRDPAVHTIVEIAPTIQGWSGLIAQPLLAALAILVMTALSVADDLGSGQYLPFGGAKPRTPLAPGPYGSAISYGPYGGPGANGGSVQAFGPGPYEGAGPAR
ncbi:DUF2567 domain-containing protein [Nocardia sp. NPDC050406]|uniref:DUF2567 domain-containing protein n=1 Tax=Nocardia sp. NPDC050406 TaxID=3364318 RepID=UPI0037892EAB